MRMSRWTPEIVRFMEDATLFTPYFSAVAALVRAVMPKGGYLCDAGCGMGQLSRELASWAGAIDAVDVSPAAIAYVQAHLGGVASSHVDPRVADFSSLGARHLYDCMVFSLSANPWEAWRIARKACSGKVVVVNKIKNVMKGDDVLGQMGRPLMGDFASEVTSLRQNGLACEGCEFVFEYGQPFRSLADAQAYYRIFRDRSFPQGVSREYLASFLDRTDNETFPYYLPIARHVGVVTIDVAATLASASSVAVDDVADTCAVGLPCAS